MKIRYVALAAALSASLALAPMATLQEDMGDATAAALSVLHATIAAHGMVGCASVSWSAGPYLGPVESGGFGICNSPTSPSAPVLISPFDWQATPAASWYQIWIGDATTAAIYEWHEAAGVCGGAMCSVAYVLEPGEYTYWVRGWNDIGYGAWSAPFDFTVSTN